MLKELKRVYPLIIQTFRQYGFTYLFKETIRYIRFGPIPEMNGQEYNEFYESFINSYSEETVQEKINELSTKPVFSIIIPVYNVKPALLDQCIQSVINQQYPHWEICLYDDASTKRKTIACLKKWEKYDKRIKIQYGKKNQHISGASNSAIGMATGDFICLLDNDDTLVSIALYEMALIINKKPTADFIYSDEDKISKSGELVEPYFKSDFNFDLLLANNYICHFVAIRKTVGDKIGWFRKGYEGAQDHDLFIRISEITKNIVHIPKILYHWRKTEGSTADSFNEKDYASEAAIKLLNDYLDRNNIQGSVHKTDYPGAYRIKRSITEEKLVSIIIPFKDQVKLLKKCISSIINKSDYKNYEIILVSNNSSKKATFDYLKEISNKFENIKVFEHNIPFNYSEINNWAVQKAKGEYILLLNNDIEAISKEWLSAMVEHIQRPEVGAVGAKLLYSDNTVQHAGVVLGIGGVAGHSCKNTTQDHPGYYYRSVITNEFSACTAACLMVKKEIFSHVGGLNETDLKIAFNDIDLCLKIGQLGYKIIYTPYSLLYHYESKSRGLEDTIEKLNRFKKEESYMKRTWGKLLLNDPFYNPNLSLRKDNFSLPEEMLEDKTAFKQKEE